MRQQGIWNVFASDVAYQLRNRLAYLIPALIAAVFWIALLIAFSHVHALSPILGWTMLLAWAFLCSPVWYAQLALILDYVGWFFIGESPLWDTVTRRIEKQASQSSESPKLNGLILTLSIVSPFAAVSLWVIGQFLERDYVVRQECLRSADDELAMAAAALHRFEQRSFRGAAHRLSGHHTQAAA